MSLLARHPIKAWAALSPALRITLLYLGIACAWILLSDRAVSLLAENLDELTIWQTLKGWLFVGLMGLLLYRERAEAERRAQERLDLLAQQRVLFEEAPEAMLVCRTDDLRVVAANEAAERLWGSPRTQVVAQTARDLIDPADGAAFLAWADQLTAGQHELLVGRLQRSDRSEVAVQIAGRRLSYMGKPAILLVVSNITALKRAEATISALNAELERRVEERTAQLEQANRDLEAFAYSVSHDLRAPLRAITGFAQIILSRQQAGMDDENRHYLDNIVEAGARMGRMIDDLLAYSRIGRHAIRLDRVDLGPLVAQVAGDFAERAAAIGATIAIADDLPVVLGDVTLLRQTFSNLIDNGLTYRRAGVAPRLAIGAERAGEVVRVHVSDNGIGIAPEYHEKIFVIFKRLHSSDEYPGSGIGLAITKRAVELMGGALSLTSAPGEGSTFTVQLPAALPKTAETP